jgi:hypothetical protein
MLVKLIQINTLTWVFSSRSGLGLPLYESSELIEQPLGLFQVERLEALAKPTINRSEQLAGLVALASIAPDSRAVET